MASFQNFIQTACIGGTTASKQIQMQISQLMQDWAAHEINERLEANNLDIRATSVPEKYAGGWRNIKVDVSIGSKKIGLILAFDPKHLQSQGSIRRNWKNTLNDLIAFSANFHSRFPTCVIGGMIGFDKSQVNERILDDMYSILKHVGIRDKPSDQHNLLEAIALAVYECDPIRLSPNVPPPNSPLRCTFAFDRIVDLLIQRYVK